jgi:hypothetical protein
VPIIGLMSQSTCSLVSIIIRCLRAILDMFNLDHNLQYNELRNIAYNAFNFHMVQALFADVAKALRATDAREPTLLSRVMRLNAKDLD